MSGIYYDQDSTNAFYNAPLGKMSTDYLDLVVDRVSGGQIKKYFMCPGSSTSIANLKSWEIYAEGFDLSKGPEQPVMCGLEGEWPYRFAHNLHSILKMGIDPAEYILKRAKSKGMDAWLTMRMNDMHHGEHPESPIHCKFWKQHPELRISDVPYENSLDYSHREVRDFYLARAFEVIEKYTIDGFQTDWTRFPTFVPHGQGKNKAPLITEMMRAIKKKINEKSKKYGVKIGFGARVLGTIELSMQRGLDVVAWCREGLIDYVVAAPFLMTTDFDIPVEEWKNAIDNPSIDIVYGIDATVCAFPGAKRARMTAEEIRGVSASALQRGAAAIYLFNFFQQILPSYPQIFHEIGSLETLRGKPRTVIQTWNDNEMTIGEQDKMNRFPGWIEKWKAEKISFGQYKFALPATISGNKKASFNICTGPAAEPNQLCMAEITLSEKTDAVSLSVNGKTAEKSNVECGENTISFSIPDALLVTGKNRFEVSSSALEKNEILDFRILFR